MKDEGSDATRRTYTLRLALERFWKQAARAKSRGGRLFLLRQIVAVRLPDDPYVPHDASEARRHFQKRKQKGRFTLQGWCWVCERESPDHRHHIVPLKHGGRNIRKNVVNLCRNCHGDVHVKELPAMSCCVLGEE